MAERAKAATRMGLSPADDTTARVTGEPLESWPVWLPRRLLTIEDLAEILQISRRTARRMIDSGRLPRAPLGRFVRVRPEAVLDLINGHEMTGVDNNAEKYP
jgi:excisionase family DNA binding protein